MPETITDFRSPPFDFLISAITLAGREKSQEINKLNKPVEIQLIVNGVEISFLAVVNDWWRRINEDVDSRAAELQQEKFEEQLTPIYTMINEMQQYIRDKVNKTFDVKMNQD